MDASHERPAESPVRGTAVIVSMFGGLVVLGWLLMFFGLFVSRGTH